MKLKKKGRKKDLNICLKHTYTHIYRQWHESLPNSMYVAYSKCVNSDAHIKRGKKTKKTKRLVRE